MRRPILLPALLAVLAGPAVLLPAQSTYVYAASDSGYTSANAYPLDNLPDGATSTSEEIWFDLFVRGPDRWLLRGDGKVSKNGVNQADLADDNDWRGLVVDDQGSFYALRKGGRVSGPEGEIANFPSGDFNFLEIIIHDGSVYILKTNGAVFRVPAPGAPVPEPLVKFDGPPGEVDGEQDGDSIDTAWIRMAVNPLDGRLWALRRDGTLKSADIPLEPPLTPDEGTLEAGLPYDDDDGVIDKDELYADLTFDVDGTWYALRADGKLYDPANQGPPAVDFPGEPSEDQDQGYVAVLARDGTTLVLRDDGKLYRDLVTTAVIDLKDDGYFGLALGSEFPDLSEVKNQAPTATSMTITAPEGSDIELPVLATDRDLPSEDLVLTIDPETLPTGATWDEVGRVISWPAAGPAGTYKVHVLVDDGLAKPVKAVQTIKIQTVDDNAEKNVKPVLAKVKRATALVALPFSLPLPAFDRDEDAVTLELDESGKPLPAGASFDELESTLEWDAPTVADKGTFTFNFLVGDGTVTRKIGRKVKVDTSLLAF